MSLAFVALGGNLDRPAARLLKVMGELDNLQQTRLLRASSLYRTAPVGYAGQPDFVNAVALIDTALPPHALMAELLACEAHHGRVRDQRNGPRTLDLDLLLYQDQVLEDSFVTLPHPRMHVRPFVLVPLLEIAPDCVIPGRGEARALLATCLDRDDARRIQRTAFDWGLHTLRRMGKGLVVPENAFSL
jgi:2-amino-4-hydroxy-6-hydroxymethyldihydropteridine diphosphokinase